MPEIIQTLPTRPQELNKLLDDVDAQIMARLPESQFADVIELIAKKVKLEVERSKYFPENYL